MSTNFQVNVKKRNGNLHIQTRGDFDGSSACRLINLLHQKYNGSGRVYIDTHGLRDICPFGCSTFQCRLNQRRMPANKLTFMGKNGTDIAPEGSHVIVTDEKHKCDCSGDCANCPCSRKKRRERELN